MKHHRWMATNGRLDQETVWFVEKNRISAKKWKTTFFFRNNFGLANNDRGSTQQKMAEMQTQDRESHSKMMGFWLKHGVPTHADLGLAFNPSNQWWETTSGHNQLPDMVKTLQRSQIVLKKNPVAGRLVCNFFAPGRRFKRTWTLWSTRPENTEPSWGHCSINWMDVPRLAASNKISPGMMKDSFTGLV